MTSGMYRFDRHYRRQLEADRRKAVDDAGHVARGVLRRGARRLRNAWLAVEPYVSVGFAFVLVAVVVGLALHCAMNTVREIVIWVS